MTKVYCEDEGADFNIKSLKQSAQRTEKIDREDKKYSIPSKTQVKPFGTK